MPDQNVNVNTVKVECPTKDAQRHNRWCYENRAVTTDNFKEATGDTYTRWFQDADEARFFRFDNGIKG